MSAAVNPAPRRFRLSLGWVLAQQLIAVWVGVSLTWGVGLATGLLTRPQPFGVGVGMTAVTLGTVLTVAGLVWWLTFTPRPDGLAFSRLVGRPAVVAWDAITEVRPRTMILIPQLVLTVRERGPVVLPLRLDDLRGFAEAVAEFAGPDHHLTQALWERLADDGPAG